MLRRLGLGFVALVVTGGGCVSGDDSAPPPVDDTAHDAASQALGDGEPSNSTQRDSTQGDSTQGDSTQGDDASERAYFVRLGGPSAVGALLPGQKVHDAEGKLAITRRIAELTKSHAKLRPGIAAVGATIIGDFRKVVNAFQVITTADGARRLAELPGVVDVERSPIYTPTLATGLLSVQAPQAWDNGGGTPFTGLGVRMGIIDSGVDYLHADFGGSGDPADYDNNDSNILEPGTFPNARVIGGFDFAGDSYNGQNNPFPDPDPLDCRNGNAAQHGSHVAGIAGGTGVLSNGTPFAGPYNASFDPSIFSVAPGVAPQADLYALKVFGCSGGTTLLLQAFEWAVDPNGDNDLSDRLDVVNLSLGTTFALSTGGTSDIAAGNLFQAGTLLVAAAGNDGDTAFAHGSPASLPEVLSVGASIAVSAAQLQVTAPASVAGDYAATEGSFTPPLSPTGIGGEIVAVEPALGCTPLSNAGDIAGKVAFVQRGSCAFLQKFSQAEAAGAIAVVMVNNEPGVFQMGGDGSSPLPGLMISQADGATLLAALNQETVTGSLLLPPFSSDDEAFANFLSSRGPSVIDGALKPDISAPGVSIVSANGGTGIDGVANTGTSMASPFVAGAAAVVRQAFPTLEPGEVKALMMSANEPLRSSGGDVMPIAYQGSGRLALADIVDQTAFLRSQDAPNAVSLSFGHIESVETVVKTTTANLVNLGDVEMTYDLSIEQVHPLPGVTITVAPSSVTVAPQGTSETITVEIVVDPVALGDPDPDPVTGALTGVFDGDGGQVPAPRAHLNEADGWLLASSGGNEAARVPFHGSVRAGASRQAIPPLCSAEGEIAVVPIVGESSHPTPVATAFQLGALDDVDPALPARADLRAVGAATNYGVFGGAFEDAEVYFGVAVEGTWRTAAIPEVPLVSIEIDLDGDRALDYLLIPEPNSRTSFAFADYLVARSYIIDNCNPFFLDSCERTPYPDRLPLNIAPADELDTAPFYNGVIVLPAFTRSIGLTEEAPSFSYRARSLTPASDMDVTEWATFDLTAPAVDPAGPAPTAGLPVYVGDEEVVARVAPGASEPKLLVLHHMNPERSNGADGEELRRFEVVDLSAEIAAPVTIAGPASAETGSPVTLTATWTNPSATTLTDVALGVSATAGVVQQALSSTATCSGAVCTVAELGPGETIDAIVQLVTNSAGDNLVTAELTSANGCAFAASGTVSVVDAAPSPAESDLRVSGGCGCRLVSDSSGSSPRAGWLLGLVGLGLWRRRQRR
jgi:MYXO-CTERM domain-containing protein